MSNTVKIVDAEFVIEPTRVKERRRPKHLSPALMALIQDAADAFSIQDTDEVLGSDRHRTVVKARHVVMWVMRARWKPEPSYPDIGAKLGYDHTTVMNAVARMQAHVDADDDVGRLAVAIADGAMRWSTPRLLAVPGEGLLLEPGSAARVGTEES